VRDDAGEVAAEERLAARDHQFAAGELGDGVDDQAARLVVRQFAVDPLAGPRVAMGAREVAGGRRQPLHGARRPDETRAGGDPRLRGEDLGRAAADETMQKAHEASPRPFTVRGAPSSARSVTGASRRDGGRAGRRHLGAYGFTRQSLIMIPSSAWHA
jgi:hypothetical protein